MERSPHRTSAVGRPSPGEGGVEESISYQESSGIKDGVIWLNRLDRILEKTRVCKRGDGSPKGHVESGKELRRSLLKVSQEKNLCHRLSSKHVMCINSLSLHNDPWKHILLLSHFEDVEIGTPEGLSG